MLLKIFGYVARYPQDLQPLGQTCKRFNILVKCDLLWKEITKGRFNGELPTVNLRDFFINRLSRICNDYYSYLSVKSLHRNIYLVAGEILSSSIVNNYEKSIYILLYKFSLKPTKSDVENAVEGYTTPGKRNYLTANLKQLHIPPTEGPLEKILTSKKHYREPKTCLIAPLLSAGCSPTSQTLNVLFDNGCPSYIAAQILLCALDNRVIPSKLFPQIRRRNQFRYEDELKNLFKFSNPSLLMLSSYIKLKRVIPKVIEKIQKSFSGHRAGSRFLTRPDFWNDYFSTLSAEPLRVLCGYLSTCKTDLGTLESGSSVSATIIEKALVRPAGNWEATRKIMSQFDFIKTKENLVEQQDEIVKTVCETGKNLSALSQLLALGYRINSVYLDIALYHNQRHLIGFLLEAKVEPTEVSLDVCVQYSRHRYILPLVELGARPTSRTFQLSRTLPKYELSLLKPMGK